ncbi:MAG: ArsI/CadI family heavy metal resistance metalloenzyme [Casimicrobium sp.]
MKRFHVHVSVDDLAASTRFYSALFGAQPSVEKSDYAKWMLEDPRVNFAISKRGSKAGLNHFGFQADTQEELAAMQRLHATAELALFDEGATQCCYAKSSKHWVRDPQGLPWEMYHTMGEVETYNGERDTSATACCVPDANTLEAKPAASASCGVSCGTPATKTAAGERVACC